MALCEEIAQIREAMEDADQALQTAEWTLSELIDDER